MSDIDIAVARLTAAQRDRIPCPPVRDLLPADDTGAAYAVQSSVAGARIAAGARVVGRKIGLTNPKVQAQLGVDQPDFGVLFDDMRCPQDEPISIGRLMQPRIEAEIAFVLGQDLGAAGTLTADRVRGAVAHVVAALEIVDSRIAGWDITIVDTIADNGSAGLFVLGDAAFAVDGVELAEVAMTMRRGGEIVSTGTGADCLGHPLEALAWLARAARDRCAPLRAGDVVLSGALGPVVPVQPGDTFTAELTGLGPVRASFSAGAALQA
jgi:2-keto-4-pentenoate hydratase